MLLSPILVVLALVSAGFDLATRLIPNWLNAVIFLSGGAAILLGPSTTPVWSHLAHFGIALAVALAFFRFGLWGGGDAKFYAAVALWFPLSKAVLLALLVAMSGLVLVAAFGLLAKVRGQAGWSRSLPYGVAIAAGTIAVVCLDRLTVAVA